MVVPKKGGYKAKPKHESLITGLTDELLKILCVAVGHQKQTFMETPVQVCVSPTIPIEMGLQKDCFSASRLCMNCGV